MTVIVMLLLKPNLEYQTRHTLSLRMCKFESKIVLRSNTNVAGFFEKIRTQI